MRSLLVPLAAMLFTSTTACAGRQPTPIVVSSAGATGYALDYPERLSAEARAVMADRTRTDELLQGLGNSPGKLKPGADRKLLLSIVAQADEAGRGAAYATATSETQGLRAFWDEERGPISARVNAAAEKQLTAANCPTADVSNGVGYALKDGVDTQLEKRLRSHNEAHRTIERYKTFLGQGNLAAVQQLADDVAMASYLLNSALVADRDRLARLIAEQGDVDDTLARAIEGERAAQAGTTASAAERKTSQQLSQQLAERRSAIPAAVQSAQKAGEALDQQIENGRKSYAQVLAALNEQLSQPEAGSAAP